MSQQMAPPLMPGPAHDETDPDKLRNLMVNYIPTTVDEMQLRMLFERYGPVEKVKIVCDRDTHQSRGYGFVLFQNPAHANQAMEELNGFGILNKHLKVAIASPRERERNEERRKQQGKPPHHQPPRQGGMPNPWQRPPPHLQHLPMTQPPNQQPVGYPATFPFAEVPMQGMGVYPPGGIGYGAMPQPPNMMMNNAAQYQAFRQPQQ